MVDNLSTRLTRIPEDHEFTFSAYNNNYGGAWSSVSALPVRDFEARWNALETTPPAEPSLLDLDLLTTPSLFGGTFRSQTRFIKQVVASHLITCKGDWEMGIGAKHGLILRRYLRNPCPDKAATRQALHLIEWRNGVMELADTWIAVLQLPRPAGGKSCAHWDRRLALGGKGSSLQSRMWSIAELLREHGLGELLPERHDCEFNTTRVFLAEGFNS